MKIEDEIYIPHICQECSTARLILRDDLHDHPEIICTECGGVMQRWGIHKEAPQTPFSEHTFDYLTYTQKLREITGSPWDRNSGTIADVRKKVGQDLVQDPGMPNMILSRPAVVAAELRAEMMKNKVEDIVVTLVCNVTFTGTNHNPGGTLHIESLRLSQVVGRVHELQVLCDRNVKVLIVYSDDGQLFGWNDLMIDTKPRLPGYDVKYNKKRKGYRNTTDGVI